MSRLDESEPVRFTSGRDILDIRQPVRFKTRGTGFGPVAIAINGIDLTIVGQEPERLGQRPAGHGIGRKTLVKNTDRGFQSLVVQILVKTRQIHRHHQALIGNYAAGQTTDVIVLVSLIGHLCLAPRHEQPGTQILLGDSGGIYEDLFNQGQAGQGDLATYRAIGRDLPPTEHLQALIGKRLLSVKAGRSSFFGICIEEYLAYTVSITQLYIEALLGQSTHKLVWHLEEQAAAITGFAI